MVRSPLLSGHPCLAIVELGPRTNLHSISTDLPQAVITEFVEKARAILRSILLGSQHSQVHFEWLDFILGHYACRQHTLAQEARDPEQRVMGLVFDNVAENQPSLFRVLKRAHSSESQNNRFCLLFCGCLQDVEVDFVLD